jgi:hypothetical protein
VADRRGLFDLNNDQVAYMVGAAMGPYCLGLDF